MATKEMFLKYGTPKEILTDRITALYPTKRNNEQGDSNAQCGFMCNHLGIAQTARVLAKKQADKKTASGVLNQWNKNNRWS